MSYRPQFTITPALLGRAEAIAVLRERIQGAAQAGGHLEARTLHSQMTARAYTEAKNAAT